MIKRLLTFKAYFWLALTLLSLAGGYVIHYATAVAPWAFSDSTVYIASGINWIKGNGMGFLQPDGRFAYLTHFPPGYPVLIGFTSLLLPDPIVAVRWLNIISFTLLIFFGGLLLNKITQSRILPLLYGALLIFSPFLVKQFSGAMSEAPAIVTGTIALLLLVRYRQTNRKGLLLVSGLLSAAAVFIRYQQMSIMLAGGFFLLFLTTRKWKFRFKDTFLYALFAAAPFGLWLVINAFTGSGRGPRILGLGGSFSEITQQFFANIYNITKYWFPWRTALLPVVEAATVRIILTGLFVLLIAIGAWRWRKSRRAQLQNSLVFQLVLLCAVYVVVYLLFLWAALLFANPAPDIDSRMLSPLLPLLFILLLAVIEFAGKPFEHRWPFAVIMTAATLLFCINFTSQERKYVEYMHYAGEGFTSTIFKNSPLVAEIRAEDAQRKIITNSPALVQFFTLREPYRTFDTPTDSAINSTLRYGDGDTLRQKVFREECAALVIFEPDRAYRYNPESSLYYPPSAYGVTDGLTEIFSDQLGNIYLYPGCK